jgi:hypothetical protein
MTRDALGDRMKAYEAATRYVLPRRTYTILRLDGRAFHTLLRHAQRPFDAEFAGAMDELAAYMCGEVAGSVFGYVQSDEISILMQDFESTGTQPWFGGVIQKIVSVAAAEATRAFSLEAGGTFDARVSSLPDPAAAATHPRDIEWARRCATEYAQKPTDARARNAAQCLPGILAAYDDAVRALAMAKLAAGLDIPEEIKNNPDAYAVRTPPELCQARHTAAGGAELVCFLAAQHHGDHSTNAWPNHRTWPKDGWRRAGYDPCPARSHKRETCTKGYMHVGAHEWGTTRDIETGPDLPAAAPVADATEK